MAGAVLDQLRGGARKAGNGAAGLACMRRPRPLAALLLAGCAAWLAAACSTESPTAIADASAGEPVQAQSADPVPAPSTAPRPSLQPHPYAELWRAAAAGTLAGGGARPGPASPGQAERQPGEPSRTGSAAATASKEEQESASGAGSDAAGAQGADDGNAPERGAAQAGQSDDESDAAANANAPAEGHAWRPEDLGHLAPYLEGIASWYGPNFHGKPTANGEVYNQFGLTAAHPVLPIGTRILVENLSNGRKVWLRVNDRGPYAKGRVLDLSRIAAERLGMIEQGTAPVRITVLRWPETLQPALGLKAFQQYLVQSAAYPDLDTAEDLRERLQAKFPDLPFFVDHASNGFFAVAAGPFDDEREAKLVSRRMRRQGLSSLVKRFRN